MVMTNTPKAGGEADAYEAFRERQRRCEQIARDALPLTGPLARAPSPAPMATGGEVRS